MTDHLKSSKSFENYLRNHYKVSKWETFAEGDCRFKSSVTYPLLGTTRNHFLCSLLSEVLDDGARIGDIGVFPGTQARLLKALLPFEVSITGVGLGLNAEFRDLIAASVSPIHAVDLDPFYAGHDKDIRVPMDSESLDAAYAMEIIEHLITPIPMLSEIARILKPGGILVISTPNVSHFGALMCLLRGKSNYEALDQSPMCIPDSEWRGHIRLYSKEELIFLGAKFGLSYIEHYYYQERGHGFRKWSGISKPYYHIRRLAGKIVPFWREDQIIVFKKS